MFCAYITGKISNYSAANLKGQGENFVGDSTDGFCFCEMDPGRYGPQQGWDKNSVIVVSSLMKIM